LVNLNRFPAHSCASTRIVSTTSSPSITRHALPDLSIAGRLFLLMGSIGLGFGACASAARQSPGHTTLALRMNTACVIDFNFFENTYGSSSQDPP
jgi:hypothetical protein